MTTPPLNQQKYKQRPENIQRITDATTQEAVEILRLPNWPFLNKVVPGLVKKGTRYFGVIADEYDQRIEREGLASGTQWFTRHFVTNLSIEGTENVPRDGGLLAIANHAGGIDVLAAMSAVPRNDLLVVALEHEMIKNIPNANAHMLYLQNNKPDHVGTFRSILRELDEGKSVLIFPAGQLEPDPQTVPGAIHSIHNWSPGIGVFLYKNPDMAFIPIAISGVLSPDAYNLPWARIRSTTIHRQRTALLIQTLIRFKRPQSFPIHVKVRIGPPITKNQLAPNDNAKETARAVREYMSDFLSHLGLDQLG